jgi:hypothetical protein
VNGGGRYKATPNQSMREQVANPHLNRTGLVGGQIP